MQIKKAKIQDIPELCLLLDLLFSQEIEFVPNREAQVNGLTLIISNDGTGDILIAKKSGKIIGMVNLLYTVSTALGERVAVLEDMVVMPEARGLGIGSKLLTSAFQLAEDNGIKRITLLTDHDNKSAHNFYQQHGFERSSMVAFRKVLT